MTESSRRKIAAEAFGTFALVFAGTGAIVINEVSGGMITHIGIAITFGLIVLAMIYAIGDVSGCHLNPAVTLGFYAARRFEGRMVMPYIAAQCGGAVIALEAMFAGPISGASMNPARSLAPALLSLRLEHLWLYLAAPVLGAVVSVAVCRCVQAPGCCGGVVEGTCP